MLGKQSFEENGYRQGMCFFGCSMLEISRFWPFLCQSGVFIPQVVDWIDLPREKKKQFYIKCKNGKEIIGNADLHFRMLALRIEVNYCV